MFYTICFKLLLKIVIYILNCYKLNCYKIVFITLNCIQSFKLYFKLCFIKLYAIKLLTSICTYIHMI